MTKKSRHQQVDSEDKDFITDGKQSILFDTPTMMTISTYSIVTLIIIGFLWASLTTLDEVTVGTGLVVPSKHKQIIQSLDAGVLREIRVEEGDIVQKGDVLVKLDPINSQAAYEEHLAKYHSLRLANIRLMAQAKEQKDLNFDEEDKKNFPNMVTEQENLFEAHQNLMKKELETLQSNYQFTKQEYDISYPLVKKGLMSELELIKIKRAKDDILKRIFEAKANFKKEALDDYNNNQIAIHSLQQRLVALKNNYQNTEIISPIAGIVNHVSVNTLGGVVQSGMTIMEVIPYNDTLQIETKIKPQEIAFIKPGVDAVVKFDAYDFAIYGGIKAKVIHVSPSTIMDKDGVSFYKIKLRTFTNSLESDNQKLPILPGMTAQVDILTGKKTVLSYIAKPLLRAKHSALRER